MAHPPMVTVAPRRLHQSIDGFGVSEAFQRARLIQRLPPAERQRLLDLLFSKSSGAGFSILRVGIGSSLDDGGDRMRAVRPGLGTGELGDDGGQLWLAQEARRRGLRTIYADAWSAPGDMKTNGTDSSGGMLCGVVGTVCAAGDRRQAYADHLARYLIAYRAAGVPVSYVGFLNEPDNPAAYASMVASGTQAAEMVPILARTLAARGVRASIVCCDAEGWESGRLMLADLRRNPAADRALSVASAHGYTSPPDAPLVAGGDKPSWVSEWSSDTPWTAAWDDASGQSGMAWARKMLTALTRADASAILYWWGVSASSRNSGLIRLAPGRAPEMSGRFRAMAALSRSIRPGARRVEAETNIGGPLVAAFRGSDGAITVELLNEAPATVTTRVAVRGVRAPRDARLFITDRRGFLRAAGPVAVEAARVSVALPARSLTTLVLRPDRSRPHRASRHRLRPGTDRR